jgi:hypothetical protein
LLASGIADARPYRVLIDSKPEGATVYIGSRDDGEVGETPYSGELEAGQHVVILELDGYAKSETTIDVLKRRKRQKFSIELDEVIRGVLEVTAPSGDAIVGAEVRVDGETIGLAPDEFQVAVGPHVVNVIADGFEPYEEWIEVEAGEVTTVSPDFGSASELVVDDTDPEPDAGVNKPAAPPRETGEIATAMMVIESGLDLGGRHLSYSGADQTDNLRPYDADGVPFAHIAAEVYPLAGSPNPWLRAVGASGSFGRALAVTSSTEDGMEVDTAWGRFEVGLRFRRPTGDNGLIGGGVSYGNVAVKFDAAALGDETPEVEYKYLRFAVDGRLDSGSIGLFGGAGLLVVSEAGTIAERFRDASTIGFAASGGFSYSVLHGFEARAVVNYQLFATSFTSELGDTFVADGAIDHIYGVLLGAAYIY